MQTNKTYYSRAFTMQELLVGLVISSIIIGMTYTIYVQINKQLIGHNRNLQELMEFNQFRQVLSKDVLLANAVEEINENEFKIVFADEVYNYRKSKNSVVRDRNNGLRDTFDIEIEKIEFVNDLMEGKDAHLALQVSTQLMGEEIVLFEGKTVSNARNINRLYLNEY